MVAVSPPRLRSSILESLVGGVSKWRAARRATKRDRPRVLALILLAFLDELGTLLAGAALTLGGFLVATWLGFMLLGVVILAVDYTLTVAVRRRATR